MINQLWSFLSVWYNLPYTALIGIALLLAVVQLLGLGGEPSEDSDLAGHAEADFHAETDLQAEVGLHADTDIHADADLHADAGAEASLDHSLEHDLDHDVDHDLGQSALGLLAFLGVGKAPLLVVLPMLFGFSGLLGWLFNAAVQSVLGGVVGWTFALGVPAAIGAASLASARLARFIGRALPPVTTTASRAESLVGRIGTVISPFVDEAYGLVQLRNGGGTLMSVFAIVKGAAPIKRGQPVVLVAYEAEQRRYVVVPAEVDELLSLGSPK